MEGRKRKNNGVSLKIIQITRNDNTVAESKEDLVLVVPKCIQISTRSSNEIKKKVAVSCKDSPRCNDNKKIKKNTVGTKKVAETLMFLDERTGEVYECPSKENDSKQSSEADLDSLSEKLFYCIYCGNSYQTQKELNGHQNNHNYFCRLCGQNMAHGTHQEHEKEYLLRIYPCHICGLQLLHSEMLKGHLRRHFEQQTFENVLDMESEYNVNRPNGYNFSPRAYSSNIKNIIAFLSSDDHR